MNKELITQNIKVPNNTEILKKYFSQCFDKNGYFNLDKFKNEISENESNFAKESYSMDWLGKSYARLLATDSATTLLKENTEFNNKKENINSENILIKGDNLEVLKHLVNAYYEKIKMIYIDPPYNTGNDGFVYQDDRKFSYNELQQLAGISEEKAKRILYFTQSKSNSHSAWLTFMYPRLYIAKQLLKEDGVIFISIDDNEVAQLKLLMDEIFGEDNFVALAPRKTGAGSAATRSESELRKLNDYVFIYQKSKLKFKPKLMGKKKFPFTDKYGDYYLGQFQASGSDATRLSRPKMYYPIYILTDGTITSKEQERYKKIIFPNKVNGEDGRWLWSPKKLEQDNHIIHYKKGKLHRKIYYDSSKNNNIYQVEKAWFDQFRNASGTKSFNTLFEPQKKIFSHPKPVELIMHLFNLIDNDNDNEIFILDFFAGSGTTGDAVMQLNAEDGGNRKFILVQIPEKIDPKKNRISYNFVKKLKEKELKTKNLKLKTKNSQIETDITIFEITKERLIRASKKINTELEIEIDKINGKLNLKTETEIKKLKALRTKNLQLKTNNYFKIFETMPIWEDYDFEADELEEDLKLFDESKLTKEDLNALLITWKTYDGIPLTQNLQKINLCENINSNSQIETNNSLKTNNLPLTTNNYQSYYANSKLYLMNKGFTTENLKNLLEKIDADRQFNPTSIIAFGYHFESKNLREISENIKSYANKKSIDIDFIIRY